MADPVAINQEIYNELANFQNVTAEPLYSVVTYATSGNAAETNFFDAPTSKNVGNVEKARELPIGHLAIIEEIRVSFMPDVTPADLKEIMKDAVLKFAPNTDARPRYFPLFILGAGGGAFGAWTQATAADEDLVTHGSPQQNAVFILRKPEVIRGGKPFVCAVIHPAAVTPAAATKVTVVLAGLYAYPVADAGS